MGAGRLSIERTSVRLGGNAILQNVTFALHPGELCALVGPSGAGKSTLMKVLLGLRSPSEGEVKLGEGRVLEGGPIGYVPQDDALHRTLTVRSELGYAAELRLPDLDKEARKARVNHVVASVGLSDRLGVKIGSLSGGQRKRVSVALELLTRPDLLILDEPTSGLDPGLERTTMELFHEVATSGRIVLVATHAMESLKLCQALLILVAGQVVFFGPPQSAPDYFDVDRFASMFSRLNEAPVQDWVRKWRDAPLRKTFAQRPAPALATPPLSDAAPSEAA